MEVYEEKGEIAVRIQTDKCFHGIFESSQTSTRLSITWWNISVKKFHDQENYFFSTGETRPIKSNLTCDTKNLIYIIQCNRCNLQYIGETKRRLKDRFNEHRRTIDNPDAKSEPTTAAKHFLYSRNHTANDMQLIPIEKTFSNRDSIREAREAFFNSKRQNN